jgi:hypothetical protein
MDQETSTKRCPYCGEEISFNAKKCKHCGEWLTEKPVIQQFAQPVAQSKVAEQPAYQPTPQQQVVVNQIEHRSNGVGMAGFVIALICACLSWLPGVNVFLWFIGLLLSFIGMFKRPRGLAVVGFFISIIDIIIIVNIVAFLGAIGGVLLGIFN